MKLEIICKKIIRGKPEWKQEGAQLAKTDSDGTLKFREALDGVKLEIICKKIIRGKPEWKQEGAQLAKTDSNGTLKFRDKKPASNEALVDCSGRTLEVGFFI